MDLLTPLAEGLAVGFQPDALFWIAVGTVIGMIVGAAPGIGPTVGMAVMLPITLRLSPEQGIFLMSAILVGANFGNSIPAVLVRIPGSSSALLTIVEGYPFQQRGEGGRALLICLISSVVGQTLGVLMFILFVIPLSQVAVRFLFPEIFALTVFGLLTAAGLLGKSPVKGLVAVAVGLLLSMVGTDPVTGQSRLGFGIPELEVGISDIALLVGLLALREVFLDVRKPFETFQGDVKRLDLRWPSLADLREVWWPTVIGSVVGTLIGILPGNGGAVSSFISYRMAKMFSKKKHLFGKGSLEGLAAVDSANNGAATGEMIPTLGLGIPGTSSMVLIMAALAAQGIIAGPQIMQTRPGLIHATFGGLMAATLMMGVIGYVLIWPSVYISRLSRPAIIAVTMVMIVLGVYVISYNVFDLWVCLAGGVLGYILTRFGYPVMPATLAFVLGPTVEASLRRGLIMTDGLIGFVSRPAAGILLTLAVLTLVSTPAINWYLRARRQRMTADGATSGETAALFHADG